jgi:hypothetical protein
MFDMTRGACLDEKDPDVFFSNENNVYEPKKLRYAKFVCMGCPIKMECRDEGDRIDAVGVWGGLTEKERRRASSTPSAVMRDKKVMAAFRIANSERSKLAAELDMHLYKEALETRGEKLPVDVYKLLEARISNPNLSLSQLGKVVGMSKDAASGKLRRVKTAIVSGKDLV